MCGSDYKKELNMEDTKSYLKDVKSDGHFQDKKSYRGSMNVGVNMDATFVGNQPRQSSTATLEARANK